MAFDLFGGYEDNISPDGSGTPTSPVALQRSGVIGTVGSLVRYRQGSATSGFEASGQTSVNSFRNMGVRPLVGATGSVQGNTRKFKTDLNVAASTEYRPTFTFGILGSGLSDEVSTPPIDPTAGIMEMQSINSTVYVSAANQWSSRQWTTVSGTYARGSYGTGGLDMASRSAGVSYNRNLSRRTSIQTIYTRFHQTVVDAGGVIPVDSDQGTIGFEYRHLVSRNRNLVFSGGGGAVYVSTLSVLDDSPFDYVAPSGYAVVRLDLGRTWSLTADARRSVTMVEGVTPQSFLTDTVSVAVGGGIGRRFTVAATSTYSGGSPHEGQTGSFDMLNGVAQVDFALKSWCAMFGSYSYGEYSFGDEAAVPPGYPSRSERNAIRVGLTIWLPLYGTFLQSDIARN